jgi:murein DD-endopeptidase MepM/ murein hydrolase activator NlpD
MYYRTFSAVTHIHGDYYASTFSPERGNLAKGQAISREFVINRHFIQFLIGGGNRQEECNFQLVVGGQTVRIATGNNSSELRPVYWDVSDLIGKPAYLLIFDSARDEPRGYIMLDNIVFSDIIGTPIQKPGVENTKRDIIASEPASVPDQGDTQSNVPEKVIDPRIVELRRLCKPGQIVVRGSVDSTDTNKGRLNLLIDSMVSSDSQEAVFDVPKPAILLLGLSGKVQIYARNYSFVPLKKIPIGSTITVSFAAPEGSEEKLLQVESINLNDLIGTESSGSAATGQTTPTKSTNAVPLIFPVLGRVSWSDTFHAPRDGGRRQHQGQDLMAPKMRPLIAAFSGTVYFSRSSGPGGHNMLNLDGDNGCRAAYMHINDDTPGTKDGRGSQLYAYAPGLHNGSRVIAGQLIAWVGNSGNAKKGAPHLHFELYAKDGKCINAAASLRSSQHISKPRGNLAINDLKVARNETRIDGYVLRYDVIQQCLIVSVESETSSNHMTRWTAKPEWRRIHFSPGSNARVLGAEDLLQDPGELQPDTPITVIAPKASGILKANTFLVQRPGFIASDLLAVLLAKKGLNTIPAE